MIGRVKKVKLKGNESFNFREGWLRKGIRCIKEEPTAFSKDDIMERLGVGSKMVKSIRYWLQATHLTEERFIGGNRSKSQFMTEDFGEKVDLYDPYFDDYFTLCLLHYYIVSDETRCAIWNVFFNEYDGQDFTKDNMVEYCAEALKKRMTEGASFSESLLSDDCSSVLKMYAKPNVHEDPEDSLECPLASLGLLQKSIKAKNAFYKAMPSPEKLDKLAVLYVIKKNLPEGKSSVSIEELLNAPNNVGRVFNLNRVALNNYLDQLRIAEYLTINRTAGLNMVYVDCKGTPEDIMVDYYEQAQV